MTSSIIPRETSLGRALWGTHAIWATVLDRWQRARHDESEWPGIEFDKLAHCIHLLWNALHKKKLVSFPSVYESRDGMHGPGPALERQDPKGVHSFALDVISHIQNSLGNNPDVHLFVVNSDKRGATKRYRVKPGRERAWLPVHLSTSGDSAFRGEDAEYIKLITNIFVQLSPEEIRALGTHQSNEGTLKSIEYNVYILLFRRLLKETYEIERPGLAAERGPTGFRSELPSLQSTLEEIERKSQRNRKDYSSGRETLLRVASKENNEVAVLASSIFREPESIWDSKEVRQWQHIAEMLRDLLEYIECLRMVFIPSEIKDPAAEQIRQERLQKQREEALKGARNLQAEFSVMLPPLSATRAETFPWKSFRSSLVQILDSLPGTTDYRDYYKRIAAQYRRGDMVN